MVLGLALLLLPFPCILADGKGSPKSDPKEEEARIAKEKRDAEAAEKMKKEQEALKAEFAYSFDDIYNKLVIIESRNSAGRAAGSGFIARMDGKTYIFSNQHVVLGADTITFKTAGGETLRPLSVELSASRDIARLEIAEHDAFETSAQARMDSPVGVFGNSEGAGVSTELYGRILGIGADLIEVSAEFVSGNSGSPVLNQDQQVLGIASYVKFASPSKMKEGTRFEHQNRRFCYRVAGGAWTTVDWRKYNGTFGKAYLENEILVDSLLAVLSCWDDDIGAVVSIQNQAPDTVQTWVKSHNAILADKNRGKYGGSRNKEFKDDYAGSTRRLTDLCNREAKRIRAMAASGDITGFIRSECERQANTLDAIGSCSAYCGNIIFRY